MNNLKNKFSSGGNVYETMAREIAKNYAVKIITFDSSICLPKKPVIAIIYHIDYKQLSIPLRIIYPVLEKLIFYNLKKVDAIVVISKYWEKYFKDRGYKNIYLIYNAFDVNKFVFSDTEIKEFKHRYNLTKPIIYLGNCQKAKGVVEAYECLKDLDVHLVTSGKQKVKIPVINLDLEYKDYLRLLKASDIVLTMSKFKEGWCRTAHEAMLCRTPVIGSGKGGMFELLEEGDQTICPFDKLKGCVEHFLANPSMRKAVGEYGYEFAKDFTLERFKNEWLTLIKKI